MSLILQGGHVLLKDDRGRRNDLCLRLHEVPEFIAHHYRIINPKMVIMVMYTLIGLAQDTKYNRPLVLSEKLHKICPAGTLSA